jgi:AAA+ ATPase superfamily predicted ATPase
MERASPFIGRHQEVSSLRKELDRKRPSLVTVYGRRRVGKSTLLAQHSCSFKA